MAKYYTYDNILKYEADFYLVLSGRSNGKSYAMKKMMIDNFFNSDGKEQFVLVRRYAQDLKQKIAQSYFGDMTEYLAETYHAKIKLYQGVWYVKDLDEDDSGIKNARQIGFNMAVSECERFKGSSYPNVTLICYEEIFSMGMRYLNDEVNLWNNLVSTVVRKRTNVKVFMIGNTISKYSPYTDVLGIDVSKLEKGTITPIDKYPNSNRYRIVIERGISVKIDLNTEGYYQYIDKSKQGSMINSGDFELETVPLQRKGITTNDMKPYHNYHLIYIKVANDYFMLMKGRATEQIINPLWERWKEEQDDTECFYYTFSNVDSEEEPPKFIETFTDEILGFEEVEEPNDLIKKQCRVYIFNCNDDIENATCYLHLPDNNPSIRNIMIKVLEHNEQDWLIYNSHETGNSVRYALKRI